MDDNCEKTKIQKSMARMDPNNKHYNDAAIRWISLGLVLPNTNSNSRMGRISSFSNNLNLENFRKKKIPRMVQSFNDNPRNWRNFISDNNRICSIQRQKENAF